KSEVTSSSKKVSQFKVPHLPPAKRPPARRKITKEDAPPKLPRNNNLVSNSSNTNIMNEDTISLGISSLASFEDTFDDFEDNRSTSSESPAFFESETEKDTQDSLADNSEVPYQLETNSDLDNENRKKVMQWMSDAANSKVPSRKRIPYIFKNLCVYYFSKGCRYNSCRNLHKVSNYLQQSIQNLSYNELMEAYTFVLDKYKLYEILFNHFADALQRFRCTNDLFNCVGDVLREVCYNKTPFIKKIVDCLLDLGIPFNEIIKEIFSRHRTTIDILLEILFLHHRQYLCTDWYIVQNLLKYKREDDKIKNIPVDHGLVQDIMIVCYNDRNIKLAQNIVKDIIEPTDPPLVNLALIFPSVLNNVLSILNFEQCNEKYMLINRLKQLSVPITVSISDTSSTNSIQRESREPSLLNTRYSNKEISANDNNILERLSESSTMKRSLDEEFEKCWNENSPSVNDTAEHSPYIPQFPANNGIETTSNNVGSYISQFPANNGVETTLNNVSPYIPQFPSKYGIETTLNNASPYIPQFRANNDIEATSNIRTYNNGNLSDVDFDEWDNHTKVDDQPLDNSKSTHSSSRDSFLSFEVSSEVSKSAEENNETAFGYAENTNINRSFENEESEPDALQGRHSAMSQYSGRTDVTNWQPQADTLEKSEALLEADLLHLKKIIDAGNKFEFLELLTKFKNTDYSGSFVLSVIVFFKSKSPKCIYDMIYQLICGLEQIDSNYMKNNGLKKILEMLCINVIAILESHQAYEYAGNILSKFRHDLKGLVNTSWFCGLHRYEYSEAGKYLYFCKIFVKSGFLKEAWQIITEPELKLLSTTDGWTVPNRGAFDKKLKTFVLRDLLNISLERDINFAKYVLVYFLENSNIITEVDIWAPFNNVLARMLKHEEQSYMEDLKSLLKSIIAGWYKSLSGSVMRSLFLSLAMEISPAEAIELYEACCSKNIYQTLRGDEKNLTLQTDMLEQEIYMMLHVYFYKKIKNNFSLTDVTLNLREPVHLTELHPATLLNPKMSIRDLRLRILNVLASSFCGIIHVDYRTDDRSLIIIKKNHFKLVYKDYWRQRNEF
ncbi:hypothetical protein ILUMI_02257, partial [Ignelater luminosus]